MKKEFLLIEGTVYPFDVLITTADDKKVFSYIENKKSYKLSEKEKEAMFLSGNGKTTQLIGGQVIIRLKKYKTKIGFNLDTLVHEIEHAVWFIFSKVGIEHNDGSDEAFAYFQAYLVREALDFWDK